jgi:hypothetical protein
MKISTAFIWLSVTARDGSSEHFDSIKDEEFLDKVSDS